MAARGHMLLQFCARVKTCVSDSASNLHKAGVNPLRAHLIEGSMLRLGLSFLRPQYGSQPMLARQRLIIVEGHVV